MVLILSFLLTCIHALEEVDSLTIAYHQIDKTPIKGWNIMRPFTGEGLNIRNWDFGGDTIVNNDKFIRLTDDAQSRTGSLWSNLALDVSYFAVEFDFQVIYQGGLSGDGFAFWLSPEKGKPGPVFGREDQFKGIGFLFDEYPNSRVRV